MPLPFNNTDYKKQTGCALLDGGHGEIAINRDTGEIEFSRSWDGVTWSTPVVIVTGDWTPVSATFSQESAANSDRLSVNVTTQEGDRLMKGSDDVGANWDDYQNL